MNGHVGAETSQTHRKKNQGINALVGESMIRLKLSCMPVAITVFWAVSFALVSAEPVLIKLNLKTADDYAQARSAGVLVYHRFENFVLAEFEKSRLAELNRAGLKYRIVDENPWTEGYFLVTSREEPAKVDLESYGRIMLKDTNGEVLKTKPEKAEELRALRYTVIPIRHQYLPLEYRSPGLRTQELHPYSVGIDSLLNLISPDSLYAWDLRLQNFKTRYSYSDSIVKARDWLSSKFASFGIDSLWLHHYYYDSNQWNVVATIPGTAQPDRVMVVGGHYDSVVYGSGTDPFTWAPGADDNGSGTVAALEMARIVAQHPLPVTVMFVPFAQEEQGLFGSYYFASYLHNLGTNVELMINSDMIGHSVDSDPDVMIYADPRITGYINTMINMANTYTGLRPVYGGQEASSDNYSFYEWGYSALCALEGDFNYSGWHTNYDVVDSLNYPYMREVVKMCFATLLYVGHSPSPVESLDVKNAGDGHTVCVKWSPNPTVENVTHYNVYFGTASGEYDSAHQTTVPVDTLRGLTENTTYFVTVTAVNAGDYESVSKNEVSATTYHFTLDQGILLVNETYDQPLLYDFVNDDSINAFYDRALYGYTYTYSDHSCPNCYPQNQLQVSDLLHYSPVIVHSEDNRGVRSLGESGDSTYEVLREYLRNGGKVIIEGRRNLSTGNDGDPAIRQFLPGEIQYDYLKVKSAYIPPWSPAIRSEEFVGAESQGFGYPEIQVDSLRVAQSSSGLELLGRVPGVGYMDSLIAGEVVYRFNSAFDTSDSKDKAVAFRYLGSDFKVIFFDFPLYFVQEAQACSLLHRALSDLGVYPSAVAEEESNVPISFSLKQNYPNPFNAETVIEYSLPREGQVKITIYNLLGQKVKDLVDQKLSAGHQKISWDGKNDRGEVISSGIYFYRMEANEFTQVRKMVFLK
jgi:hypothetical protein